MADDESLAEAWLRSFSMDSVTRATHHSNNFQILPPVDLRGMLSNFTVPFAPCLFVYLCCVPMCFFLCAL
jgi:hypothetical protein